MRYFRFILLGFFALALPLIAGKKEQAQLEWKWLDFSEALPLVSKLGKPMIINFYSTGCFWCRKMDDATFADSAIAAMLSASFIGAKVNNASNRRVEWKGKNISERELALAFMVRGTPMTAFLDKELNIVATVPGYVPPDRFALVLKYVEGGWFKDLTFQEFVISEQALKKKVSE